MIGRAAFRKWFAGLPWLYRTVGAIGLIRTLLVFAVLVEPVPSLAGANAVPHTLKRPSANLSVSAKNSSGPLAASSNFTCLTQRPLASRPTARLVAAYGFEKIDGNKTPDLSGKSPPATLVNAVLTAGQFGKGIKLNGTNAFARIDEPSWPRRDYTYGAWVFPLMVRVWRAILEIQTPESKGFELAIAPGGYVEIWSSGKLVLRNGLSLRTLAWTHVAVTRSGALITLFLDGVAHRAGRDGTAFDFGSCPALIGVDADFGCAGKLNGFFSGVIDDIRVYDCALSASEIRLMMKTPMDRAAS